MSKPQGNWKNWIITVLLVLGAGVFFYRFRAEFLSVRVQYPAFIIPVVFASFLFLYANGLYNKYLIHVFGITLKWKEWFGLSVVNTVGNFMVPLRGGTVLSAVYLKKAHKFTYSNFISILSASYLVIFLVNSVLGLGALVYVKYVYGTFSWVLFLVFAGMILAIILSVYLSDRLTFLKRVRFLSKFVEPLENWKLISKNKPLVVKIVLITVLNMVLICIMNYYEFRILGLTLPFSKILLMSVFSSFSLFISFTPGSLGIREAFAVYSGLLLNFPFHYVVAASIIDRLVNFLISLIFGLYFSGWLYRESREPKSSINPAGH